MKVGCYRLARVLACVVPPAADACSGPCLVLGTATQAALLLEAGVMVNRDEELMLAQPHTRATIAQAVADGVRSCLP